jgi:hypothetical protein
MTAGEEMKEYMYTRIFGIIAGMLVIVAGLGIWFIVFYRDELIKSIEYRG